MQGRVQYNMLFCCSCELLLWFCVITIFDFEVYIMAQVKGVKPECYFVGYPAFPLAVYK